MIPATAITSGLALTGLLASVAQAQALEPLPPCFNTVESGMLIGAPVPLGHDRSGIMIEGYEDDRNGGTPAPPDSLKGFSGMRIVACASGRFLTLDTDAYNDSSDISLPATEFLRRAVQDGRPLKFDNVVRAARAVYPGRVALFRETDETCGCSVFFPNLKPAELKAFDGDPYAAEQQ